jgi:Mycobacterium 19 kDa lipoprotein antigen
MQRSLAVYLAAVFLSATACSSAAAPAPLPAGALAPGTIDVSINGQSAAHQRDLTCTNMTSFTTATAANGDSTVRAVVNNDDGLNTVAVEFTDVAGFTGSYLSDVQGKADARLVGSSTFLISGVANGFFADRPANQTTSDFTVRFAC